MQAQFDLVLTQRANGMFEVNLPLIQMNVELVAEFVSNGAGSDRAEHLAVLAGLDLDEQSQLGDTLREFAHGVELVRFALGAALA